MTQTERHLLVTISEDNLALFGLRFVNDFFHFKQSLRLTLFYVLPNQNEDPSQGDPVLRLAGRAPAFSPQEQQYPEVLLSAKKWLEDMGFPPDRVELKSRPARLGPVKDIVQEAERGLYDAVVLGRRGLGWFDEFFLDSVTHRMLWESITFPLWVCRNPARHRRNVLLCVDGSEQSLRMADHVGFILKDQPEHQITVFHCLGAAGAARQDVHAVMAGAGAALAENGIEDERISFLVKTAKDPAGVVLREAAKGEYAAVALGRSSGRPDTLANIFGSTSLTLLRNLEGAALWLSK